MGFKRLFKTIELQETYGLFVTFNYVFKKNVKNGEKFRGTKLRCKFLEVIFKREKYKLN